MTPDSCAGSLQRDKSNKAIKYTEPSPNGQILHTSRASALDTGTCANIIADFITKTTSTAIAAMGALRMSSTTSSTAENTTNREKHYEGM